MAARRERYEALASESRYGAPLTEHVGTHKPQPELCLQCHQMRRAQLQRSSHMPYREGKVTCTSCHNPHGSPNPSQLIQSTVNENCYSCHAERRGPFLWEHPPVMENCANCHEPHGSSNPQLLKVRMPRVCDSCHDLEPPSDAAAAPQFDQELQPGMHQLPFPDSRIEPSLGEFLHAVVKETSNDDDDAKAAQKIAVRAACTPVWCRPYSLGQDQRPQHGMIEAGSRTSLG